MILIPLIVLTAFLLGWAVVAGGNVPTPSIPQCSCTCPQCSPVWDETSN